MCWDLGIGILTVKPQLFPDQFYYDLPARKKKKQPPRAIRNKRQKRQQPAQKQTTTKTPKVHLTEEQKRERKRALAKENSQQRKELGLCKSCPNQAIEGQTRCPDCAEKHRAWNLQYSENRRRAQGIKPRPPAKHTELIGTLQTEPFEPGNYGTDQKPKRIRSEAHKKAQREKQAALRAERDSLGLCRDCGKPKPEDQTRCDDCVIRHSRYWSTYVAKRGKGQTNQLTG